MFIIYCGSWFRKWGGEGDDDAWAEDAPHAEAGEHRGAEGGVSAAREAVPGVWVRGEGETESAEIFGLCSPKAWFVEMMVCVVEHAGAAGGHAQRSSTGEGPDLHLPADQSHPLVP